MNRALLITNIVLGLAVVALFILYFSNDEVNVKGEKITTKSGDTILVNRPYRIAYFDMDSVESSFALAREMQAELNRKDDNIAREMNRMQSAYQQKFQKYNEEGPRMGPADIEAAQKDLFQMEQSIKSRKSQLDQEYQNYYVGKQQEIINLIKEFCREYNKDGRYSMIIANEPGLIYYKDSTYNITQELLKGLNEMYAKKKK